MFQITKKGQPIKAQLILFYSCSTLQKKNTYNYVKLLFHEMNNNFLNNKNQQIITIGNKVDVDNREVSKIVCAI